MTEHSPEVIERTPITWLDIGKLLSSKFRKRLICATLSAIGEVEE